MVLVKGSLPTTSTNDRSEKNDRKYKKKFLNQNISKNFNKDNGQPMVLVKGSLPTTSTNERSEKNDRKRNKYKMKKKKSEIESARKALSLSAVLSMPNIVKHGLHVLQ